LSSREVRLVDTLIAKLARFVMAGKGPRYDKAIAVSTSSSPPHIIDRMNRMDRMHGFADSL
jgi:hypothetical protein